MIGESHLLRSQKRKDLTLFISSKFLPTYTILTTPSFTSQRRSFFLSIASRHYPPTGTFPANHNLLQCWRSVTSVSKCKTANRLINRLVHQPNVSCATVHTAKHTRQRLVVKRSRMCARSTTARIMRIINVLLNSQGVFSQIWRRGGRVCERAKERGEIDDDDDDS